MTIKVMYDLSLLGVTLSRGWNCAGICRVTQSWADSLAQHDEISIDFHYGTELSGARAAARAVRSQELNSRSGAVELLLAYTRTLLEGRATGRPTGFRSPIRRRDVGGILREVSVRGQWKLASLTQNVLIHSHDTRARRADVFHDTSFPGPSPALTDPVILKHPRMSKVVTVYDVIPITHADYFPPDVPAIFTEQLRKLDNSHWVVCSSAHVKAQLCELARVDAERIKVIPWAADSELFYRVVDAEQLGMVRQRYAIPEAPFLLSVCTLEPRKNLIALIRSFAELATTGEIPGLTLVLVGGSGWIPSVISEIDELAAQLVRGRNRVVLTGFVPDHDLAALYSGALAFVYPSIVEGFGLPPLEAMQCGVPVITSSTSALPEVVADAGVLVDPLDRDALCQAILDVCSKPALRQELSERSLAQAAKFSWERTARETVDLYRLAIANPS